MTAWITRILIIITLLAILYAIFQKMSLCILFAKGVLPLVPIQHYTPRHRTHGYFRRGCKPGFAEAMWAHFASIAVHPSQLRITGYPRAYDMHIYKTLLLPTATGRLAEYNSVRFGSKHN